MSVDLGAFKDAFQALLSGQTSAGARVYTALPKSPTLPAITFKVRGAVPWRGYHQGEAERVLLICWGGSKPELAETEADTLYTEVRNVLLPPATPAEGYYGVVQGVNFSGVSLNAGPDSLVDPYTEKPTVQSYWLVGFY